MHIRPCSILFAEGHCACQLLAIFLDNPSEVANRSLPLVWYERERQAFEIQTDTIAGLSQSAPCKIPFTLGASEALCQPAPHADSDDSDRSIVRKQVRPAYGPQVL